MSEEFHKRKWYVYIVHSEVLDRLYTGIALDPVHRTHEHNTSPRGAKATRGGRPWRLVHIEGFDSKGGALSREAAIKRLRKAEKLRLFNS